MRKSFYHILLLGALTLGTTSSCDDYLEVDHYDILPEDFMYRNEANIKSGLYGIYDTFYGSYIPPDPKPGGYNLCL